MIWTRPERRQDIAVTIRELTIGVRSNGFIFKSYFNEIPDFIENIYNSWMKECDDLVAKCLSRGIPKRDVIDNIQKPLEKRWKKVFKTDTLGGWTTFDPEDVRSKIFIVAEDMESKETVGIAFIGCQTESFLNKKGDNGCLFIEFLEVNPIANYYARLSPKNPHTNVSQNITTGEMLVKYILHMSCKFGFLGRVNLIPRREPKVRSFYEGLRFSPVPWYDSFQMSLWEFPETHTKFMLRDFPSKR